MFSYEICEIFKRKFYRTPLVAASEHKKAILFWMSKMDATAMLQILSCSNTLDTLIPEIITCITASLVPLEYL